MQPHRVSFSNDTSNKVYSKKIALSSMLTKWGITWCNSTAEIVLLDSEVDLFTGLDGNVEFDLFYPWETCRLESY